MSISTQIARIQADRNTIRAKLVELGMANNTDNLDALAVAISNIVNKGAVRVEVKEGETYTIPAGYHNGTGTVAGVAGGGSYSLQTKTVTPTKNQQAITSDEGYYGLSGVTVEAIPDAYQNVSSVTADAASVLVGKIFVDKNGNVITGTMPNHGAKKETLDVTSISYTIPKGYHDGTGVINIVLETKNVTPSKSTQTITPASGKVLSKVTVNPIPDEYQDVSSVDAEAADVLTGKTFVDSAGEEIDGTMANRGAIVANIDGLSTTSYTIPVGYHNGKGTVSLSGDIEEALAAI